MAPGAIDCVSLMPNSCLLMTLSQISTSGAYEVSYYGIGSTVEVVYNGTAPFDIVVR
jgi:hypothetical protein